MASVSAGNRLASSAPPTQIQCPHCHKSQDTSVVDGHRTVCRRCSRRLRRVYQFCWACRREWPRTGSLAQGHSCSLPKCGLYAALLSEEKILNPTSAAYLCPFFRACPECKALLTHNGVGCRYITCPGCHTEFCFRCLRSECNLDGDGIDDFYEYEDEDEDEEENPIETCVIVDNSAVLPSLQL